MLDAAPKPLLFALLRRLGDGEFHSGESLAGEFGLSRASIHNALIGAESLGLTLYRVRGRGYRLPQPPQWLEAARLEQELGVLARRLNIDILDTAASSNTLLLQRAALGAASGSVLAVEWQTAGRGRLGRTWHSGLAQSLTFSLLWRFERGLASLAGLSLVAGVAILRALRELGIEGAQLKWPNDVLAMNGGKLAGILLEAQGDMLGPSAVVIGIGLNLTLPDEVVRQVDQPASSLAQLSPSLPERNRLFAALLRALVGVLDEFTAGGFAALQQEWQAGHAAQDRYVVVSSPDGRMLRGVARGVTVDGRLRLETELGEQLFSAGDVSLRGS